MSCDNFLIFYLIESENKVVISRVLYGKRDIEEELKSGYTYE